MISTRGRRKVVMVIGDDWSRRTGEVKRKEVTKVTSLGLGGGQMEPVNTFDP